MSLGLGLSLGGSYGGGEPMPLYTTADMVIVGAPNAEILSVDSLRYCRNATTVGRLVISGVPSGNYRISGTLAAYNGAVAGIATTRLEVTDNFTNRIVLTAAGDFDQVVSITSGTLRFQTSTVNGGGLVTNLFIGAG